MIAGDKGRFAIEAEIRDAEGGWVWGGFRFWIDGDEVGDWADATALHLCCGWLRKFHREPFGGVEPLIFEKSPEEIFGLVVDPVFAEIGSADGCQQLIPNAYERFHIGYLGMSSLDSYVVLLVKNIAGIERCLWRKDGDSRIGQCRLAPGELERVAEEFCNVFERQAPSQPEDPSREEPGK